LAMLDAQATERYVSRSGRIRELILQEASK